MLGAPLFDGSRNQPASLLYAIIPGVFLKILFEPTLLIAAYRAQRD